MLHAAWSAQVTGWAAPRLNYGLHDCGLCPCKVRRRVLRFPQKIKCFGDPGCRGGEQPLDGNERKRRTGLGSHTAQWWVKGVQRRRSGNQPTPRVLNAEKGERRAKTRAKVIERPERVKYEERGKRRGCKRGQRREKREEKNKNLSFSPKKTCPCPQKVVILPAK